MGSRKGTFSVSRGLLVLVVSVSVICPFEEFIHCSLSPCRTSIKRLRCPKRGLCKTSGSVESKRQRNVREGPEDKISVPAVMSL
jgi:hypothetical protein